MLSTSLRQVIIVLLLSSTLANVLKNDFIDFESKKIVPSRIEGPPSPKVLRSTKNDSRSNSTSGLSEVDDQPRDKRALGTILQGLVEVFGYTPSPISLASLPNPNPTASVAAAAPPTIFTFPGIAPVSSTPAAPPPALNRPNSPPPLPQRPQRPPKPMPPTAAPPMTPRQRETLRLTGVLNFGNNSDLLGHLQQYEKIFHGRGSTTAAPPPTPQPTTSGPGKLDLLPPFFVKIPLPIAPNLPAPLPSTAPRKLPQKTDYKTSIKEENYERESDEIQDEKDVRVEPPRDTYIDEPEWLKKQRESQRNKYKEEDSSDEDEDGSNESREKLMAENEDSRKEEESEEEGSEENDERNDYRQEEKNEREEDDDEESRERYQKKRPAENYSKNQNSDESAEYDENDDERDDQRRREVSKDKGNPQNSIRMTLGNYNAVQYSPQKMSPVPRPFMRLPIRVLDVPHVNPHEFRNSYGQSLEHEGHIDESVADYFERYKHPDTGLFDSRKIESLETARKRDPWWQHQNPGIINNLPNVRQEYEPKARARYEEYRLEPEQKRFFRRMKNFRKRPEEDEQAEPTVTTYSQIKMPERKKDDKRNKNSEKDEEESRVSSKAAENDDSIESTKPLKVEDHELSKPKLFKGFDFIKYSPYFKPLQIAYEPEKLQRTADRILSYHNFGKFGDGGVENDEKSKADVDEDENERSVGYTDDKNAIKPEVVRSEGSPEMPRGQFNPYDSYVKPIRYEYRPESLQKTSERISSYQNVGKLTNTLQEDRPNRYENGGPEVARSPDNLEQEDDDESEVDGSPENLRQEDDDEEEDERSSESLREEDEDESGDDRSSENLREEDESEDDRSSENLRQEDDEESEERRSSENLRGEDDDESEEHRSSENLREEDDEEHRSSENLREEDEPNVNRYSANLRIEAEDDDPDVNRHSSRSRNEDSSEEPEVNDSSEDLREEEESEEDKPEVDRSLTKSRKNYAIPEVGLPERLTGRKLHEGEYKEKNLWPAPFDHTFDSTESTKIVATEDSPEVNDEIVEPTNETPAVKKYSSRIANRRNPQRAKPTRETPSNDEVRKNHRTGSRARDSDISPTRESLAYKKFAQLPVNGAPKIDAKKLPERARNSSGIKRYRESIKPEVTRDREDDEERLKKMSRKSFPTGKSETFEDPESAHDFFGLSKDDYNLEGATGERRIKEKMASKNTTPLATNPKELIGLLTVRHEDPNYKKDVNLTEFTDKPESDTEKVRVKEYRNKVATISVSERKQLSPNGPVQVIGFTRHF